MKSSGTLYWYGLGGEVLAETDNSGNTLNEYIYFAASRIARRDSAGNVYYYYGDHLRSSRSITTATATLCYDAAGNLTQDGTGVGTHTFQWDGEGRLVSVDGDSSSPCASGATLCFTYNALGERVEKHVGSPASDLYYYYDAWGNLAMTQSASQRYEYIFPPVAGRNYVKYYWNGSAWETDYLHVNNVGSTQVVTRANYNPSNNDGWAQAYNYFPWGGRRWSGGGTMDVRFASMQERDSQTTTWQDPLDPTWFRTYTSGLGRWLSPDPVGGSIFNPQSLNRYAYVLNNPTNFIDPLGLWCEPDNPYCQKYGDPVSGGGTACDPVFGCPPPCDPFSLEPICSEGGWGDSGGGGGGGGGGAGGTGAGPGIPTSGFRTTTDAGTVGWLLPPALVDLCLMNPLLCDMMWGGGTSSGRTCGQPPGVPQWFPLPSLDRFLAGGERKIACQLCRALCKTRRVAYTALCIAAGFSANGVSPGTNTGCLLFIQEQYVACQAKCNRTDCREQSPPIPPIW